MGDFENKTGGAEVVEVVTKLRIHERDAFGAAFGSEFVVIDDDAIDALVVEPLEFLRGSGAAVESKQEVGLAELLEQTREAIEAQAIALVHAGGEERDAPECHTL